MLITFKKCSNEKVNATFYKIDGCVLKNFSLKKKRGEVKN